MILALMLKCVKYPPVDITPETSLYIPFNEGVNPSATVKMVKDYSQYNNHGTFGAGTEAPLWKPNGLVFDGVDDNVDCGDGSSLNISNDEHTICVLINPSNVPAGAVYDHRIVNKGDGIYWWNVDIYRTNGNSRFECVWDDDVTKNIASANAVFTTNAWYYVVGKRKGTEYALFVNSIKQTDTETVGNDFTAPNNLRIGNKSDGSECYDGIIKEIRIYSYAVNEAQVAVDCYEVVCA